MKTWKSLESSRMSVWDNWCWIRPKLYSLDFERLAHFEKDDQGIEIEVSKPTAISETRIVVDNKNAAKGIQSSVAKKLTFENFEHCLKTLLTKQVDIKRIGSDHHNLFTYSIGKIGLSAFDTKRWICDDGISTYAFGHWRTK